MFVVGYRKRFMHRKEGIFIDIYLSDGFGIYVYILYFVTLNSFSIFHSSKFTCLCLIGWLIHYACCF